MFIIKLKTLRELEALKAVYRGVLGMGAMTPPPPGSSFDPHINHINPSWDP